MRSFCIAIVVASLVVAIGCYAGAAVAQETDCSEQLLNGVAPALTNVKMQKRNRLLCFSAFVVLHSGVARQPLWSAEHLTAERIRAAQELERPPANAFHAETRLPASERSRLADYKGSGFDRGHMSPNGDMPDEDAQQESFSLANIVPQHPCNNEVIWEGIESAVRDLVLQIGEAYVVTGPAFIGNDIAVLHDRVLVPTHIFKAIYVPSRNQAGAYFTPNDGSQQFRAISVAELQQAVGIDPFPDLDSTLKSARMALPDPTPHHRCRLGNQ